MYLQITTKCNMKCMHCIFDCNEHGSDMSLKTAEQAFKVFSGDIVSIGGGEPTLNPNFWAILGMSLLFSESVWLATNGSQTDTAIRLANMAREGKLGVALSQDEYHDYIDPKVIAAFCENRRNYGYSGLSDSRDMREIRTVSYDLINGGRAKENGIGSRDDCACDELFITPQGRIYACGCKEVCFGTVWDHKIPDWYYDRFEKCTKNRKIKQAA